MASMDHSVKTVNKWLVNNPALTTAGSVTTFQSLCKMVGLTPCTWTTDDEGKYRRYSQVGSLVKDINVVLATRGLRLRSRKSHTEFYVVAATTSDFEYYDRRNRTAAARASTLRTGTHQYAGSFRKFSKREFEQLCSFVDTHYGSTQSNPK